MTRRGAIDIYDGAPVQDWSRPLRTLGGGDMAELDPPFNPAAVRTPPVGADRTACVSAVAPPSLPRATTPGAGGEGFPFGLGPQHFEDRN